MISDYRLLGIAEGSGLDAIKAAFRRRAKELHPGLSSDEDGLPRHDLFTQVCGAYRRLVAAVTPKSVATFAEEAQGAGIAPVTSGKADAAEVLCGVPGAMRPHTHQDYVFYRQGMRYFMAIHPSQWNLDHLGPLDSMKTGDDEERNATRQRVVELIKLFPKAYYYFSLVVHEYPDSDWALDAKEKMGMIETRIGM